MLRRFQSRSAHDDTSSAGTGLLFDAIDGGWPAGAEATVVAAAGAGPGDVHAANDVAIVSNSGSSALAVLGNDQVSQGGLTVGMLNGKTVHAGQGITLKSGAIVTVNADGTLSYDPNHAFDGLQLGENGYDRFTYQALSTAALSHPSILDLATLQKSDGVALKGYSGPVVSVGDLNGDGFGDFASGSGADGAYVVLGDGHGLPTSFKPSSLDGTNGFHISGVGGVDQNLGTSLAPAGDVNGDGYGDFILGSGTYGYSPAYVVFGTGAGFPSSISTSDLDGSNGFRLSSSEHFSSFGNAVASPGDLNGDGFDDIVVATPYGNGNGPGEVAVVFGKASGFAADLDLTQLNGKNGFVVQGTEDRDVLGYSMSSAGDINHDGIDDLLLAAPGLGPDNQSTGGAYVIYGKTGKFPATLSTHAIDGSNGFEIIGGQYDYVAEFAVSKIGDINGDGIDDIALGAAFAGGGNSLGATIVVFGRDGGFGASLDVSALDGSDGFRIVGDQPGGYLGYSVASAGDVNGDGLADLIVGAPMAQPNGLGSGSTYVVFGRTGGFGPVLDLAELDGTQAFRIDGPISTQKYAYYGIGQHVTGAGDVNHDGYDDLLIDSTYLIYGSAELAQRYSNLATVSITVRNDARPGATDDMATVDEHGVAKIAVLANDGAISAGGIVGELNGRAVDAGDVVRLSSGAKVTINVDGSLTYDPHGAFIALDDGQSAQDSFTYAARVDETTNRPAVLALSDLYGTNGARIVGEANGDAIGGAVASAGDVNGDGLADFIIGNASYYGDRAYVVFGTRGGFVPDFSVGALDGTNGFALTDGASQTGFGRSVASAGDINGDGYADIVVGAPYTDSNGTDSGTSYVLFGRASGFATTIDVSTLDGRNGFALIGENNGFTPGSNSGSTVAAAGDVNGDGLADFIISAPNDKSGGLCYVVYGRTGDFPATVELGDLDGSAGFKIHGPAGSSQTGFEGVSAGDLNGDGFDDLIGTFSGDYSSQNSYVLFGSPSLGADVDISAVDGTDGFRLTGYQLIARAAGDVNGDGFADIIVGDPYAPRGRQFLGAAYVIFGHAGGFSASMDAAMLDGSNGFRIDGVRRGDSIGDAVASAGDFNGDGYGDVIVSAFNGRPNGKYSGQSYVVFGHAGGFPADISVASLDGHNGFRIDGEAREDAHGGQTVASAGDVNGDGYDDLIVGASGSDAGAYNGGASYIIYGSPDAQSFYSDPATVTVTVNGADEEVAGTAKADTLTGSIYGDHISGHAGDDILNGLGGNDLLQGGSGSDQLHGGDGIDTATYVDAPAGVTVNLGTGQASGGDNDQLDGVENVTGSNFADVLIGYQGANVLSGGNGDDQLSGFGGDDQLFGGAGNDILLGGAGSDMLTGGKGNDIFRYTALLDSLPSSEAGGALFGQDDSGDFWRVPSGLRGFPHVTVPVAAGSPDHMPDLITDLSSGDVIDLSALDADTATPGDQAFHQVPVFDGAAGELTLSFDAATKVTTLAVDVNGDKVADFVLLLTGQHLDASHWML